MSLAQIYNEKVLQMCWNNFDNNGSVMGRRGRRCLCECRWVNDNVAGESVRIALRGPGCIDGTGRCSNEVQTAAGNNFPIFCGQVTPLGNVQQ